MQARENGHWKQATNCENLNFRVGGKKEQATPKLVLLPSLNLGNMRAHAHTHTHTRFDCSTKSALSDATPHTFAFLIHGFRG